MYSVWLRSLKPVRPSPPILFYYVDVLTLSPIGHAGLVEWTSDDDSNAAHLAVNNLGLGVRSLAKSKDTFLKYEFMNDASFTQNPLKSYGVENMVSLQSTRQEYDPTGVFQNLQNSGFLLSR